VFSGGTRDSDAQVPFRNLIGTETMNDQILDLLGDDASFLLNHECKGIARERIHAPGPDFVDRVYARSDRNNRTLGNLEWMFQHGRLAPWHPRSACWGPWRGSTRTKSRSW
jgi:hypothetical protein